MIRAAKKRERFRAEDAAVCEQVNQLGGNGRRARYHQTCPR